MHNFLKLIFLFIIISCKIVAQTNDSINTFSLLALGDINLGRLVGQKILQGETYFPFEKFDTVLNRADEIFANLESQITDQNGETQSPKSNLIFCAPPQAALSLKQARIFNVSTANNHAFDYGLKGLLETIDYLNNQNILFTGTKKKLYEDFLPIIIERNNIKVGILAYTETVNMSRGVKSGLISIFDSTRAQMEINNLKQLVDFIIVSYHGGDEYKDYPNKTVKNTMKFLAECGVDIIIGHHPHVPQGINKIGNCIVFYSLGNAVFNQPQHYWTQRSFAALIHFYKGKETKKISNIELIPFKTGIQPNIDFDENEEINIIERIKKLSLVNIFQNGGRYFIELSNSNFYEKK